MMKSIQVVNNNNLKLENHKLIWKRLIKLAKKNDYPKKN